MNKTQKDLMKLLNEQVSVLRDKYGRLLKVAESLVEISKEAEKDVATLSQLTNDREQALRWLHSEVDCRIEHGAESGGHLEFVRAALAEILGDKPKETKGWGSGIDEENERLRSESQRTRFETEIRKSSREKTKEQWKTLATEIFDASEQKEPESGIATARAALELLAKEGSDVSDRETARAAIKAIDALYEKSGSQFPRPEMQEIGKPPNTFQERWEKAHRRNDGHK